MIARYDVSQIRDYFQVSTNKINATEHARLNLPVGYQSMINFLDSADYVIAELMDYNRVKICYSKHIRT